MKLKFRAEKEDILMFAMFAIFLLYIVCLAVINLSSFATTGYFSGLNPLPAFGSRYISATLTFYFLSLGGLLISVSSHFFDREKGIGFTTDKKDKGYSRWAKEKEIQTELKKISPLDENTTAAGVPLILKKDEVWVDDSEYHTLVIGATGSGKTQTVIKPSVKLLAKKGESMIITDPKGEIYESTAEMLKDKGYNVIILNFRDPQNGSAWNPMSLPYQMYKSGNQDKAIELLDDLALNILYEEKSGNSDPFWEKTSADYFSGLALGLFEDAKEEEITINSISYMSTVGEDKFGGSTYIKEYFNAKDQSSAAVINATGTIMAPTDTKGGILSVFRQKIKLFASRENLSEMLSHSDVDLKSIGRQKTAVFIVIQDEKKTYHPLVTILLKQIYETLIDVAQENGGALAVRTNFLLDEFANMPPLKDVTTMITAARSRKIRFTMIIQNFAQLNKVYGKEDAETIKGNCGNIIYLISSELAALEEISKMCGEVKSKKDDKTASTPLVTVSDLQRMKQFETIIMRLRKQPFKTKMVPDFQLNWGKSYGKATYPSREKQNIAIFDLKEFVKEQKKKKLIEMMNAADSDKPAGMPPGFMPPNFANQPVFPGDPNAMLNMPIPPNIMPNMPMPSITPMQQATGIPLQQQTRQPMVPPVTKNSQAMMNPLGQEPVTQPSVKPSPAVPGGLNIDDLVKKIDAKIAQLEEEEKKNKVELEKKKEDQKLEIIGDPESAIIHKENLQDSLSIDDNDDDDEFFDDFFDN